MDNTNKVSNSNMNNNINNSMYNPFNMMYMDPLQIITNSIFNNNNNIKNIIKKIIISYLINLLYNISKESKYNIFKVIVLQSLYLFKFKSIILDKGIDIVERTKGDKIDVSQMNKYLDVDVKTYIGFYFKRILGYITFIKSENNVVEIIYFSNSFKDKFIESCKLKRIADKITTNYNILTMTYENNSKENIKMFWSKPSKITTLINISNTEFYEMIENYIIRSKILNDNSTLAINVNGKPGVGKSTILDVIYSKNIVNSIYKINMMNFQECSDDLESIILKMICSINNKSDNEIWLICFDEIDKWKVLWIDSNVNSYLDEKPQSTTEEVERFKHSLNVKFYNTVQRFLDGEYNIKVSRYIVMFFTNFEEHIWKDIPENYISVKDRFQIHTFEYCKVDEVINYLKYIFNILIENNIEKKYDEKIYNNIDINIYIPYRKLKMIINNKLYKLDKIIDCLNKEYLIYNKSNDLNNINYINNKNIKSNNLINNSINNFNNNLINNNSINKFNNISKNNNLINNSVNNNSSNNNNLNNRSNNNSNNINNNNINNVNNNKNKESFLLINDNDNLFMYTHFEELEMVKMFSTAEDNGIYFFDYIKIYTYFHDFYIISRSTVPCTVPKCKLFYNDNDIVGYEMIYVINSITYKFFDKLCENGHIFEYFIGVNKKAHIEYLNNKSIPLNGKFIKYNDNNNNIICEIDYINNKVHGENKYYYNNGNLQYIENYINDKLSGKSINYYDNGNIKSESEYKYGLLNGEKIEYDINGNITRTTFYENDEIINKT